MKIIKLRRLTMRKVNVIIVLILIGVICLPAQQQPHLQSQIQHLESQIQQNPNNPEIHLNLGKLYFQLASSGEKNYLKKAEKQFSIVIELQPDNSTAICWSGCVVVIKAKYAWFPPLKGYYVIAGLKKMDKAVKMSPDNIENRQIRGQTCLQIPTMFNRIDTALEDFDQLYT